MMMTMIFKVTGVEGVTSPLGGAPCKPLNVRLSAQSDGVTGLFLLNYKLIR